MELSEQLKQTLDALKQRFPRGLSVLMPALHAVQAAHGHIPPGLEQPLGRHLGIPEEIVREVSTFYFMFNNRPVGRHHIYICGNISCWLRGYETLRDHLVRRLGVQPGETTPDGRITLSVVECLGMCDHAPVMLLDGEFHPDLTAEKIDQILEGLS
jgi:NADH-quinone oxidoreductase subunit E